MVLCASGIPLAIANQKEEHLQEKLLPEGLPIQADKVIFDSERGFRNPEMRTRSAKNQPGWKGFQLVSEHPSFQEEIHGGIQGILWEIKTRFQ